MKVTINGKKKEIEDDVSVLKLLEIENVTMPGMVSVELNGKVLKRDQYDKTYVKPDDKVNFVYFMGGGL